MRMIWWKKGLTEARPHKNGWAGFLKLLNTIYSLINLIIFHCYSTSTMRIVTKGEKNGCTGLNRCGYVSGDAERRSKSVGRNSTLLM